VSAREFPEHPVAAAAVCVVARGRVLLVRRGAAPNRGRWGFPGGGLEPGERFEEAARREAREETGLSVSLRGLLTVVDLISRQGRRVRFHYVIAVFRGAARGVPHPGGDAREARWVPLGLAPRLDLTATTRRVLLGQRQGSLP